MANRPGFTHRLALMTLALGLFVSACNAGGTDAPASAATPAQPIASAPTATDLPATAVLATAMPSAAATAASTPVGAAPGATAAPTEAPAATDAASPAAVTDFPPANSFTWQPLVNGLQSPIGLAHAGDGSERLFVLEQAGRIRLIENGALAAEPFLDISDRVGSDGNEQGLLGLAFHPRYAENGFFYVNYTDRDGDTVIARFSAPPQANAADPASEQQILFVEQPYANHNGGATLFGPDGYLYLGLGDGGAAGDPQGNAQSLDSLLGKILRLDVDGAEPYAIAPGNPFANGGGRPEIFAYGLRNPWRFSFDRQTGDLYIADVGQNQWEEVSFLRAGSAGRLNFGWDYFEASYAYDGSPPASEVFIAPVAEYAHDQGCSITGGYVYRGSQLPGFQGIYLYGDFCSGNVWGLLRDASGAWQSGLLTANVGRITAFGEDEAGEVYLVDRSGIIYKLAQP